MVNTANTFKASQAAGNFGKRNAPVESALGSELAVNPPTIPMVDHRGDDTETKTIAGLEKAYSIGMGVFMLDLITGIGAWALGHIAGFAKMTGVKGAIDKWLRAPIWAMRNTEIGNLGDFSRQFTDSAEGLVRKAGDTAGADKLHEKLKSKNAAATAKAGKQAGVAAANTTTVASSGMDHILGAPLRAFSRWREGVTKHKMTLHLNRALGIPNHGGMFGFFQKAGTGTVNVELPQELADQLGKLAKDPSKINEVIENLTKFAREQQNIINNTSDPKAKQAAQKAYASAGKIANSLREAQVNFLGMKGYAAAASKSFSQIMKKLPKAAGRVSVFHALIAAGVAAGVTASWMTTGRENRLGKQALRDLAADVYGVEEKHVTKDMISGNNAHPLIKEASQLYKKQARGRYISSATYTAGDAVLLATLRGIGGAMNNNGMAEAAKGSTGVMNEGFGPVIPIMAAQMGLPALGEMMVPENQTLNAYAVLKKAEKEGTKMETAEKVYLVRQLMAAVPAIARHSGHNNSMTPAVAAEIVARGMNSAEIVKTISDPKRFVEITNEAMEKLEAKKAKQAKENQEISETKEAVKKPSARLAATPANTLQVSNREHQGRISQGQEQQRA